MDLDLVRSFHAAADTDPDVPPDDALDAALGLPEQRFRWAPERDAVDQRAHPGESIVNVPTPYAVCRGLVRALDLQSGQRFVDLGCAAGRVILYGAATTDASWLGIELLADRVAAGQAAIEALGLKGAELRVGNVLDHDFADGDVFYAFRPFSVETEAAVLARLHDEAKRRDIRVVTYRLQPSLFDAEVFERTSSGVLMIYRSRGG